MIKTSCIVKKYMLIYKSTRKREATISGAKKEFKKFLKNPEKMFDIKKSLWYYVEAVWERQRQTDIKNWTERWEVEVKLKAKTTALNLKN